MASYLAIKVGQCKTLKTVTTESAQTTEGRRVGNEPHSGNLKHGIHSLEHLKYVFEAAYRGRLCYDATRKVVDEALSWVKCLRRTTDCTTCETGNQVDSATAV